MKVRSWKRAAIAVTIGALISCIPGKLFADEMFVEDDFYSEDFEAGEEILELETEGVFEEPEFFEDEEEVLFEDDEFEIDAELLTEGSEEELQTVASSGTCGDNLTWTLDSDGKLSIRGTGTMTNYDANSLSPFHGRDDIHSVLIENGVTSIGEHVFYLCKNLTTVTIPDTVTSIGKSAFDHCEGLTDINIPDSVTSIGKYAFHSCRSLPDINIPDQLTTIEDYVFGYCVSFTNITIPKAVTTIGQGAFQYCANITGLTIPDNVTTIQIGAFESSGLTSITIPNSVTTIERGAFFLCRALTQISLSDNVTSIEPATFLFCDHLTDIVIPNSVTSIGENAFEMCSSLTRITIPESVTSIGEDAFLDCADFTIWGYSDSYAEIYAIENNIPFKALPDGNRWSCGENLQAVLSDGTLTFIGSGQMNDYEPGGAPWNEVRDEIRKVVISEEGAVSIGKNAFYSCQKLTSISIPGVLAVGEGAFRECYNLNKVIIPGSVTSIGDYAFYDCINLESLTLRGGVQAIGNYAFSECASLTAVSIPDSINRIGNNVFSECTSLKSLEIPNGVETIGVAAFFCCKSLERVTIPGSVISIGERAFSRCENLKGLTIENGVTSIEDQAFFYCSSMISVMLPDSVTVIGNQSFACCNSLESILIPRSVTSIGPDAFFDSIHLTIHGYADSYAETYASDFGIPFKYIDDKHYFRIGIETNQFHHTAMKYELSDKSYLDRLYSVCNGSLSEKKEIDKQMKSTEGVCHGIATTMCLGSQNKISFSSITDDAANYWEMGSPYENDRFRDLIVYYQVLQYTDAGSPSEQTKKNRSSFVFADTTKDFLEALTQEAQRSQIEGKPFLFSFGTSEGGHSVVICGYQQISGNHRIIVFDENDYYNSERNGIYRYLTVASDYSWFSFMDHNHNLANKDIADSWRWLEYYGIDYLYNGATNSLRSKYVKNSSVIQVPVDTAFRIEDKNGRYIEYDGQDYTYTMDVSASYLSGSDYDKDMCFVVEQSDGYFIKNSEDGFYVYCQAGNNEYYVEPINADKIDITDGSIVATGDNISLITSFNSGRCDFVTVEGQGEGSVGITNHGDDVSITSEQELYSACISTNTCFVTIENNLIVADSEATATISADGKVQDTHTHSWDSGKITKAATKTSTGTKTYICTFCGATKTETLAKVSPASNSTIVDKITVTKKPTIKKPSATKNKITVKWKHFKHTSKKAKKIWKPIKKVQIQCATDKAFKNIVKTTTVKKSKTKATIKGLKKKTTYYVRVRYTDGKGFSNWSKIKKIKTKK